MENKPLISKKALAILGLMFVGTQAAKVCDYKEVNCNEYYHPSGVCKKCSLRFRMLSDATCVKIDDQCEHWSE